MQFIMITLEVLPLKKCIHNFQNRALIFSRSTQNYVYHVVLASIKFGGWKKRQFISCPKNIAVELNMHTIRLESKAMLQHLIQ